VAAATPKAPKAIRWPKNAAPPVLVEVRRGPIVESRHRGHVVQVGAGGAIERAAGDPNVTVSLRSAAKPFALLPLIESGAADALHLTAPELAVLAASHAGEDLHVRTLQGIFRRANLSQSLLACGTDGAPADRLTAARLARDGEAPGPIRHMCSGYHAASILLSRHFGWSLDDYWRPEHPSQEAIRDAIARVFAAPSAKLVTAIDACGLQTYAFPLADVARAYALLADPAAAATDPVRAALAPALTRVRDAMVAAPELVGGTRESFDTALMKALPGRVLAKSGAEALEGVALLPGSRGPDSPGAGIALAIDDGDLSWRAVPAVVLESLRLLDAVDERTLRLVARWHRPPLLDPRGQQVGETVASFELAPISELA
jgi:L-asparaginase II